VEYQEALCGDPWSLSSHENLIRVLRRGWIEGRYFIDMDYYESNLASFLESENIDLRKQECNGNPVDGACCARCIIQVRDIMVQITRGLTFLHSNNIAYERLTPRNGFNRGKVS
jgi:hypothetical protein